MIALNDLQFHFKNHLMFDVETITPVMILSWIISTQRLETEITRMVIAI